MDLFPATLTTPRGRTRRTRLAVRGDRAVVWRRRGNGTEIMEDALVFGLEDRGTSATIVTVDGETWEAVGEGSCGCGNPLKKINPDRELAAVPA